MTRHHYNIFGFIFNCSWIIIVFHDKPMMWVLLGLASLLFFSFIIVGVLFPNRNYFVKQIIRTANDKVLLTFDDGPDKQLTPEVLRILKQQDIGALFFIIGKKAEVHPEIISKIISDGHLIGNHTQNHPLLFATMRQEKVEKEIGLCDNTLIAQNVHPGNYFRPPVGYTNPIIARAVKKYKKTVIGWNLRSYDSVFKEEDKLLERVVSKVKPGDIVLFHDNLPQTIGTLDQFITTAKKNGIKFATTNDLNTIIK